MASPALAELAGVSKRFGRLVAVDDLTIEVRAAEVHAVLGENGAGKTTAMRILAGLLAPDTGTVRIAGMPVSLSSRRDGARLGIGFVQQHFSLIDQLTCAENLILGRPDQALMISRSKAGAQLSELAREVELAVKPGTQVGHLSMAERQRLEIVIALSWGASVLVLDEPTATLSPGEFEALTRIIDTLRGRGVGILFISHKLPEVQRVADRISVLRGGRLVYSGSRGLAAPDVLARQMVGDLPVPVAREQLKAGAPVVVLDSVTTASGPGRQPLHGVTISIHRNEVVGVAGVAGSGQREMARVLAGLDRPISGTRTPPGVRVAYIPEDRSVDGIADQLSVTDNLIVHAHSQPPIARRGWISGAALNEFTSKILSDFSVRVTHPQMPIARLSGGNQQRLVLGRELARKPDLIIAHNPTRGLDLHGTADIRRRLAEARSAGAGIVLISPDLEELMELSDRIVVLYAGTIAGDVRADQISGAALANLISGARTSAG